MKKNILYSIVLIGILTNICFAQKEATKWYFGNNAGLDFISGVPVPFSGSAMTMLEGVASIADTAGNTLFYTNGFQVWNKNNVVMPNGNGLSGNNNSAQAAIIIPVPNSASQYYIVTTPSNGNGTMDYSLVDMNLQGGLGDVTTKNVPLFNNSTEKVTSVQHANGIDIWLIGHEWNTNNFYSFQITPAGINPAPVVTSIGSVHNGVLGFAGYMKASHNGTKIAYAITISLNIVELLDFDIATGIPFNPITFTNIQEAYGLEFSPDDSKLYATSENPQILYQWDVNAGSPAAIIASQLAINASQGNEAFAALQLAPDGKIYLANRFSTMMGVINNPNDAGLACNFVDDVFSLPFGSNQYGLPNFFQSYFDTIPASGTAPLVAFQSSDTVLCEKSAIDFFDLSSGSPTNWNWYFPGAVPDTSTLQNPAGIYYASYGTFPVTLTVSNSFGQDSLTILSFITVVPNPTQPVITQTGNDLCAPPFIYYQWFYNGTTIPQATNQCYTPTQPGSYYVLVTDTNGCQGASLSVVITNLENANSPFGSVSITPNPVTNNFILTLSGTYFETLNLEISDAQGKKVYDEIIVKDTPTLSKTISTKLRSGMYFIKIQSGSKFIVKKFVVTE
ncbi:MAG TPA: T9SS type A sorting domain-containing protein [Bacteroidia bacterium]|nr:T9SS type A sorting domain-containing protein [Bacteroidia bacterium]